MACRGWSNAQDIHSAGLHHSHLCICIEPRGCCSPARAVQYRCAPCLSHLYAHGAVFDWLQGYAGMTQRVSTGSNAGSTVWGAHPLPQNREVTMTGSGDGTLSLWKYQYPDQRKIKVCWPPAWHAGCCAWLMRRLTSACSAGAGTHVER